MSFFSEQTRVVEIDEENSVTVRKLTHGESSALTSQCMVQRFTLNDDVEQSLELDAMKYRDLHIFSAIVSWNGPGFEDRPVTFENFNALPDAVVNKISAGVDSLSGLSSAEKNESDGPTN